jgi:phage gp36-like protein
MDYCTRSEVEKRWGTRNVAKWADLDNDQNAATIQAQIEWAIDAASRRIDMDLSGAGYVTPLENVGLVNYHAAALAGAILYNARAVNISVEQISPQAKNAEAEYTNWVNCVYSGVPLVGAKKV